LAIAVAASKIGIGFELSVFDALFFPAELPLSDVSKNPPDFRIFSPNFASKPRRQKPVVRAPKMEASETGSSAAAVFHACAFGGGYGNGLTRRREFWQTTSKRFKN
jgi:hypothetical protein